MMANAAYHKRKDELETYFDRTAVDAWAKLTSDAPVGRIRRTVRAAARARFRWKLRGAALRLSPSTSPQRS